MITISQAYKPFSHQPGSCCLIPTTPYLVEAYPSLIRIRDLNHKIIKEIALEIEGPLKQFTLMQDLERGCVTLFSELYCLHILPTLEISFKKHSPLGHSMCQEKLSLGSHKKQDWEQIKRRLDFKEIFPLWFRLGSMLTLPTRSGDNRGNFSLLEECKRACDKHRPEKILFEFKKLFLAAFEGILVPRAVDTDHQGLLKSNEGSSDSPLYLLSEGAVLIRSLFFLPSDQGYKILPNLPPEFFAGRMLDLATSYGTIDIEWSKKMIRRLHVHAHQEGEILFQFPGAISSYRVRQDRFDRGKVYLVREPLVIKSGSHYLLDRFQK